MLVIAASLSSLIAMGGLSPEGSKPFPEVPGWRCVVDTAVYIPSNLWDLIDGAAENYLMFGFVELHIAEYTDATGLDVRVEAYRHSTPSDAFGIYAAERYPDYDFIDVGTQGYAEEGILNFLAGEFYLKLSSHSNGSGNALRQIATAIDRHLGRGHVWPNGLSLLPQEHRLRNTEAYSAVSFLGHSFLRGVWSARYEFDGRVQIFVMEHDSAKHVSQTIEKLCSAVPGTAPSRGTIRAPDPNNGPIVFLAKGRFLYGVVGASNGTDEESSVAMLKSLQN